MRGIIREGLAERGISGETRDERGVVTVLREKGVASVLEEVVRLAVEGEDGLVPAQILLELGVAVLVGGDNEGICLAHDGELFLLREPAERDAVLRVIGLQVVVFLPRHVELDVLWELLHGATNVVRPLPAGLVAGIDQIERAVQFEG